VGDAADAAFSRLPSSSLVVVSSVENQEGPRGVALRPDLQVSHQRRDGQAWVVIQDPLRHRFYEMREEDYGMALRIRDGARLDEVLADWRRMFPSLCEGRSDVELRAHAERLIATVQRLGLGGKGVRMERQSGSWGAWMAGIVRRVSGVLFWRVRLWNPDGWLAGKTIGRSLGMVFGAWVVASLLVALGNVGEMKLHPEWFGRWENLLALYVGLFGLKVVHEAGHAVVCKSLGGRVPEVGMQMLGLHPTFYVDVSATWMWPDRRRRIAVAVAGIGAELVAAAGLFWGWKLLAPGFLKDLCLQLAFTASVLAILFNANPLMRYDGYHILSDLVGEPRLRQRSFSYWQQVVRRLVLGGGVWPREPRAFLLAGYGLLSMGYLGVVLLAVGRMVDRVLGPFGLEALGRILVAGWLAALCIPVAGFFFRLAAEIRRMEPVRRGSVLVRLGVAIVCAAALLWVPLPVTVERQGVLEVPAEGVVRAAEPGFVREVLVREGEWVQPGQTLVRLENRALESAQRAAELEVLAAKVALQAAQASQAVADLDSARRHLEEARAQAADSVRRVDALLLVAATEGRVVTRELEQRAGTLVRAGEEVVSVLPSGKHQVLLPLSEQEARRVVESAVARFRPAADSKRVFVGRIASAPLRVEGGGLPAALSVLAGGEIVLDGTGLPVSGEVTHLSRLTFDSDGENLRPGGTGRVRLECGRLPLGRWVFRRALEAIDLGHRL
jgi:putative peptide zinc metalloprotease protein